jgi:uncharacterized membrane protein YbjE (DUF340 family)
VAETKKSEPSDLASNQISIKFILVVTTALAVDAAFVRSLSDLGGNATRAILAFFLFSFVSFVAYDADVDPATSLPKIEFRRRMVMSVLAGISGSLVVGMLENWLLIRDRILTF